MRIEEGLALCGKCLCEPKPRSPSTCMSQPSHDSLIVCWLGDDFGVVLRFHFCCGNQRVSLLQWMRNKALFSYPPLRREMHYNVNRVFDCMRLVTSGNCFSPPSIFLRTSGMQNLRLYSGEEELSAATFCETERRAQARVKTRLL